MTRRKFLLAGALATAGFFFGGSYPVKAGTFVEPQAITLPEWEQRLLQLRREVHTPTFGQCIDRAPSLTNKESSERCIREACELYDKYFGDLTDESDWG